MVGGQVNPVVSVIIDNNNNSATGITKCDTFQYKVRQVLQSATIITKCDSTVEVSREWGNLFVTSKTSI